MGRQNEEAKAGARAKEVFRPRKRKLQLLPSVLMRRQNEEAKAGALFKKSKGWSLFKKSKGWSLRLRIFALPAVERSLIKQVTPKTLSLALSG
jgi:hypothetical protein